ncbi:MAG: CZB domain-containing protein [Bryobacteraceae bacterium]
MNLNDAILSHVEWKQKLEAHLEGSEELDPEVVGADTLCELGEWIAATRRPEPEFQKLREAHAEFHRQAAQVVIAAAKCSAAEAIKMLDYATDFGMASTSFVNAILDIRDKFGAAA